MKADKRSDSLNGTENMPRSNNNYKLKLAIQLALGVGDAECF